MANLNETELINAKNAAKNAVLAAENDLKKDPGNPKKVAAHRAAVEAHQKIQDKIQFAYQRLL